MATELPTTTETRLRKARSISDRGNGRRGSTADATASPCTVQGGFPPTGATSLRLARSLFVVTLLLFSHAACRGDEGVAAPPGPLRIETDLTTAIERATRDGRPLFVHFTADWCQPCKELKQTVYPDPEVARRLERFVRVEIDVESGAGGTVARRYGVQTVPVLMTMTPQGTELRSLRVVGMLSADQLAATLDEALEQCGQAPVAAPHANRP